MIPSNLFRQLIVRVSPHSVYTIQAVRPLFDVSVRELRAQHACTPLVYRDMPPEGGFPAIKYKRNLPFRGPSGVVILGAVTAICAFGFYRVALGNLEKRCADCLSCLEKWGTSCVYPRSAGV